MIRPVYAKAGKEKEKLRTYYSKLCEDETPLIKKAAAKELGPLSKVFERDFVNSDMITFFKKFMTDQDYVKAICLDALQDLVKLFNDTIQQRVNVSIIVQASEDKSWRIRNEMAKIFPNLIEGLGSNVNELLPSYSNLIKDSEMEVRFSALEGLSKIISNVSSEKLISSIVPAIMSLQNESHIEVKSYQLT